MTALWIDQNGRVACRDHGGYYLRKMPSMPCPTVRGSLPRSATGCGYRQTMPPTTPARTAERSTP